MALPAGFRDGLGRADCFPNSEPSNAVQIAHSYQRPVLDLHSTLHGLREVQQERHKLTNFIIVLPYFKVFVLPAPAMGSNRTINQAKGHWRFGKFWMS